MFYIDEDAIQYIKHRSGALVIDLNLNPATSSGWCPPTNVTGRYVPKLSTKEPHNEQHEYNILNQDGIKIYYSSRLYVKNGYPGIIIKLEKLAFFKWLVIEGAGIKWWELQ